MLVSLHGDSSSEESFSETDFNRIIPQEDNLRELSRNLCLQNSIYRGLIVLLRRTKKVIFVLSIIILINKIDPETCNNTENRV